MSPFQSARRPNYRDHLASLPSLCLWIFLWTGLPMGRADSLTLRFKAPHWLYIEGDHLPGESIEVNYLEAYCRAGSTDADWVKHTVIPHRAELISLSADRKTLKLRDTLEDGVVVDHTIRAGTDDVDFRLVAHNPGPKRSEAHWAQACVRLGDFTGFLASSTNLDDYLPQCFLILSNRVTRFPEIQPWVKSARYVPGQTWCPRHVPRTDVNPRPLSPVVPDDGLIGAFSGDGQWLFATAWQPYQELFQGVIRCLHSDLRLGGLQPGETKRIRGRIYLMKADTQALRNRYAGDFPEHRPSRTVPQTASSKAAPPSPPPTRRPPQKSPQ
jgi:hypothetical protein